MGLGKDHTLFALTSGVVHFYPDPSRPERKLVGVIRDMLDKARVEKGENVRYFDLIPLK